MNYKTTISAVLPVKNEEKRILRQHLENIKGFCDEIIVIADNQSTDLTTEICREYTDKVYIHEFTGIDNTDKDPLTAGFRYATGDWILLVDADFIISDLLQQEIMDTITNGDHVAYEIACCNFIFGKWFTSRNHWHWHFQLFRNGKFTCKRTDMHNRVFTFDGTTSRLGNPIFHYGVPDVHYFIENMNRYTSMDADFIMKTGKGGIFYREVNKIPDENFDKNFEDTYVHYMNNLGYNKGDIPGTIFSAIMGCYCIIEDVKILEAKWRNEHPWTYGDLKNIGVISARIAEDNIRFLEDERIRKIKHQKLSNKIKRFIKRIINAIF